MEVAFVGEGHFGSQFCVGLIRYYHTELDEMDKITQA